MPGILETVFAIALTRILRMTNSEFVREHPWLGYSILAILLASFGYFVFRIFRNKDWKAIAKYAMFVVAFFAIWGLLIATR